MTDHELADLLRVYEEAAQRSGAERQAYLDAACGSNERLRREVDALLAEPSPSGNGFLEAPPWQGPALSAGQRLGPYEVTALIGAGSMGEVYRAHDTRLGREVAVKVLPVAFGGDADRRARFEREAKTIAGLNHPHICTLFDVGESNGSTYLVMELLTGRTLAARLTKGPLPLEQALATATEIADALAAAHRQGVIHRDLKPGNVMLTKTGAKLLDFGLAKLAAHGERPATGHLASAPASGRPLTSEGAILGTLPYMAPEQVEGKPADARTDLWALGAMLHEMLTGRRAFAGASAASLSAAILEHEPSPVSTLQPLTPTSVDRLVRQCLAKAPEDRPDTAHDVANDLRWLRETSGAAALTGARPRRRPGLRVVLLAAGCIVVGLAAGAAVTGWLRPSPGPVSPLHTELPARPAEDVNAGGSGRSWLATPGGSRTALAWTPDGQALVFVGRRGGVQQLYVRRLDAAEARPLTGTEGAQVPAVSPDGRWAAFWASGSFKKVPLGGGPVMDLASGFPYPPWGLVWGTAGSLFFSSDDRRVWTIPPEGAPAAVTTLGETEVRHALPWPLPGERALLYTVRKRNRSWGDEEIVAHTLATGRRKTLLQDAADARYVPTGHLVFLRRGVLYAVPFDAERVQVVGNEVPMLDTVAQALTAGNTADVTGAGQFAVATTGTLAWVPGSLSPYPDATLVTVDRRGHIAPLPARVWSYGPTVRLSPDGRRMTVTVRSPTDVGLWVCDISSGGLTVRARGGEASGATWSPDGRRLLFNWLMDGRYALVEQPADGAGPPQSLVPGNLDPSSFTPDGRQVAAVRNNEDVCIVAIEPGAAHVQPQTEPPNTELWPEVSPDGGWLAYGSNVSGRFEVYVRPYAGPGVTHQVSLEGGQSPAWVPRGGELFFVSPEGPDGKRQMMAVEFAPGSPPRIGRPHPLFAFDNREFFATCATVRCFDVASDGQRFYGVQARIPPPPPPLAHINLITNWFEELRVKSPVR